MSNLFNESEIALTYHCVSKLTTKTPVKELKINQSNHIYLKCENEQITGSFKVRGALNAVSRIEHDHIVTASAGNHGLGIAYAGQKFNKKTTVFLPKNTSKERIEEFESFGTEVRVEGENWDEANCKAYKFSRLNRFYYIHPFADEYVILGQSSLFTEFFNQVPNLDCVVMTSGGGGLLSGAVLANRYRQNKVDLISVEPFGAPTLYESVKKGYITQLNKTSTKATSVAVKQSSFINFNLYANHVKEFLLVDDDDAYQAKEYIKRKLNQSIELSSAFSISAVLKNLSQILKRYQNIGIIVCAKERKQNRTFKNYKEEVFV